MSDLVNEEAAVFGAGELNRVRPALRRDAPESGVLYRVPSREFAPEARTARGADSVSVATYAEIDASGGWDQAFSGQYKDGRYYRIVQETLHPEHSYRYFVLRDQAGRQRAIQPFFVLDQDILAGASGAITAAVDRVRQRFPKFLTLRTLMIGCVAGEGHLDNHEAFADPKTCSLLAKAALEEAKKERAGLIVFKEFPSAYRDVLGHLKNDGFICLPSLPMASLSTAHKDFDAYMAASLSRATRKDLRRKFKAAQSAGLTMSVVEDITPFVDEIYPLYLNVYNRSKLHFEKLTKDYLCALGQRMPDRTRFFVWRQGDRIVAFNLCMVHNEAIYDQYIGLDYEVALDLHLYHYTIRDIMSWAMANGYKRYISNGLNYDPKHHLRMQLDPLDLYARHRSPIINAALKVVLPYLEPTKYDPHLKKFANYSDLRA
ncbi:GNAT family N-acetyltransferase [Rhodomicrobium sp.]|uniref:GNAT family N-acetyltransferase n=1 Tax=Rhodomicrobium sp. TaxID=2720632 RepID=UPI0039E225BA